MPLLSVSIGAVPESSCPELYGPQPSLHVCPCMVGETTPGDFGRRSHLSAPIVFPGVHKSYHLLLKEESDYTRLHWRLSNKFPRRLLTDGTGLHNRRAPVVINVPGQSKMGHGCGCYCSSGLRCSLGSSGQDLRNDNHAPPLAMCSPVEEHGFRSPTLALMAILLFTVQ